MTKTAFAQKLIIIFTLLGFLTIVYISDPFKENVRRYPTSLSNFQITGYYEFTPETVLETLDGQNSDDFTPIAIAPQDPISEKTTLWHQADYLRIASSIYKVIWKESLDSWHLYSEGYVTRCQDSPNGFSLGTLYFFKTIINDKGKLRHNVRGLQVVSNYGYVEYGGDTTFPYSFPFGWQGVNLDKTKIAAENALQIADENGGKKSRLLVENECKFEVRLLGDSNWQVRIYNDSTGSSIFEMEIDPYSGEIK